MIARPKRPEILEDYPEVLETSETPKIEDEDEEEDFESLSDIDKELLLFEREEEEELMNRLAEFRQRDD